MAGLRSVFVGVLVALGLALAGCSGYLEHGTPPGQGQGAEKVVLCHKGKKTLEVAAPAAQAHYDHGDSPGPCG